MNKESGKSEMIYIAIPNKNEINGRYAIIDGMNIALCRKNKDKGILNNLIRVYKKLQESYEHVEIIADASIKYKIDDVQTLTQYEKKQKIFICPSGIVADDLILHRAFSLYNLGVPVTIVTNDNFPVNRFSIQYENIRNLTVSILNDNSIYLLERDIRYLNNRDNKTTGDIGIDDETEYRDLIVVSKNNEYKY